MSVKRAFFGVFQKLTLFCCAMFFGFANAFSANLPSGYTELEYIESTGSQYIDTGLTVKSNTLADFDYKYTDCDSANYVFGQVSGSGSSVMGYRTTTIWWFKANDLSNACDLNKHTVSFASDGKVYRDGQVLATKGSFSGTQSATIKLFAELNDRNVINKGRVKIYNFTFKEGSTIVRDFVPAKNSSGVVGMYDLVSGTFFTNAGTGTFTAGPVVVTNSGPISSVTVAGLVAQNGTPTPTTPMDILSNNGVLKVSPNLYNKENGVLFGYPTANYTWAQRTLADSELTIMVRLKEGSTYTATRAGGAVSVFRIQASATSTLTNGQTLVNIDSTGDLDVTTKTFTVPIGAPYVLFMVRNIYSASGGMNRSTLTVDDVINAFQLELGSTATPYMPYGQIYTDGEVETIADSANHTATVATLLGVGDYRDTQNINTGAITRNVGVLVLDGTENWSLIEGQASPVFRNRYPEINTSNYFSPSLSTHYEWENIFWGQTGKTKKFAFGTNGWLYISQDNFTTAESFKQWLADQYAAGTPVIVIYPLATPTTESVAGQTMTTAPVDNRTGGVTGMTITTLLSSGASVVTTIAANAIKIATTAYNAARFSPVVTDLNSAVATIREIVTKTINQTAAIASLQADKQTRPEDACPAGKKCLLVETEENGVIVPHWFPIIEAPEDN